MLNLSMFKAVRKFNVTDNKMEEVEDLLNGETIEFYSINLNKIESLKKSLKSDKDNGLYLYFLDLIKNLTNIKVDIDVEELKDMMESPSNMFAELYSNIFSHMVYLIKSSKNISNIELKINDTLEKMGINKEMIDEVKKQEEVKSKKEQLEEINNELETCDDLKRYKELQALKLELEKE